MPRQINLRQIEAFKAVIECGTVSRGADVLNISQPAMSKLIAHLEADTGLLLFDRMKGRLAPTKHAMRLYDEIGRIFAGVRQLENAVDLIRREEQGRLEIGVMSALGGSFIQQATTRFLDGKSGVFCSVQTLTSEWVVDRLVSRKLDIGVVSARMSNPYVKLERLVEHPLVCILPLGHPLAEKELIEPADLNGIPFVAYHRDTYFGHVVEDMFEKYQVEPQNVLVANVAPTICNFVAAGLGVSLVHPLTLAGIEQRLVVRRFEPEIMFHFQLCSSPDSRNQRLVDAYSEELRITASSILKAVLKD